LKTEVLRVVFTLTLGLPKKLHYCRLPLSFRRGGQGGEVVSEGRIKTTFFESPHPSPLLKERESSLVRWGGKLNIMKILKKYFKSNF
jgi:hypothetical protein